MIRRLSVVVPALDEAERIGGTLAQLAAFGARYLEACELIVVDDGSSDGTAEAARAALGDGVRVLRHERRRGKGAAVRTGVLAATEAWVLFVDADLSVPIEELLAFAADAERAPIVIGSKRVPGTRVRYPALRKLLGRMGHWLVSALVVRGVHDTQCGFKLLRADVARALFSVQRLDGFGFDFELLFLARRWDFAIVERPVAVRHRGDGSVSLLSYFAVLLEIGRLLLDRALGRYPRRPPALVPPGDASPHAGPGPRTT